MKSGIPTLRPLNDWIARARSSGYCPVPKGRRTIEMTDRMVIVEGDITRLQVDAIVNAANESLLGGGGVDGAVHAAAGPGLLAECKALDGRPTGEARLTGGYGLPAHYIIHTVGPVWQGGAEGEDALLESCYQKSLQIASTHDFSAIAFPAISTGAYRFPADRAAMIAVQTVRDFLTEHAMPRAVTFCCFGSTSAAYHHQALAATSEQA